MTPKPLDDRIWDDYVGGHTVEAIALTVGLPASHIESVLAERGRRAAATPREVTVAATLARHDAIVRAYWDEAMADQDAAKLLLDVERQRRKLLGLDAPAATTSAITLSVSEIAGLVDRIVGAGDDPSTAPPDFPLPQLDS